LCRRSAPTPFHQLTNLGGIETLVGVGHESDAVRAVIDPYTRRNRDLKMTVDSRELKLKTGGKAELVA
jgi:hypothetical protein